MHSGPESAGGCQRVLAIGLDGATFEVLDPLAQSGVLPNLADLMRRSARAELSSTEPYITPAAWTSFQTGVDVADHGILDFRYFDHAGRQVLLNHSGRIGCPTMFDAVAEAGGEVVSINLPMTWPPPQGVRGIVVGGLDSPSGEAVLEPHPQLAARLRDRNISYGIRTIWKRKPASLEELQAGVAATMEAFDSRVVAALECDSLIDWRLMVVQFQTLDSFQHRCWHLLDPHRPAGPRAWRGAAERVLRDLDRCVGRLLDFAARKHAAVVLASDHGFGDFREKINLPRLLQQAGWLRMAPWFDYFRFAANRVRYRWQRRQLRRQGQSTAGLQRPLEALLPIDWRRSTCFCMHGDLGGLIYLNTPDRSGTGPLTTPRLVEEATEAIVAGLQAFRHPRTGEPLFTDVYAPAGRFDLDPLQRQWPDIIAIPAPGMHTRVKFDPGAGWLQSDAQLTGTHRREGVLLLDAPGVERGPRPTASITDVAPTVLELLGIPRSPHMTGRSLAPARELQLATSSSVARSTASHSAAPLAGTQIHGPHTHAPHSPSTSGAYQISAAQQAVVETRLRDLGYLD